MSRQRKKHQSNPFKALKGFCVSSPPKTAAPETPGSPGDEDELFLREASRLQVKREGCDEESNGAPGKETTGPREETTPADDRAIFLAALGKMEAVFADEVPEEAEPSATARRMKLLRTGKLVPEAELDLHGLDRLRAREKTRYFLENAVYQGKKTVLLITGKGHGSAGEPVLRKEMERFLSRDAGNLVSEWGNAPRRYGGEGALVVFLRGKENK